MNKKQLAEGLAVVPLFERCTKRDLRTIARHVEVITVGDGIAVVTEGDEFAQVQALIDEKYGFMVKVVKLVNRFRSLIKRDNMQSSAAMIVTLD